MAGQLGVGDRRRQNHTTKLSLLGELIQIFEILSAWHV
ncbi:hypothetical protein F383_02811 [Gossypium arboreum]|uniref:Uncharacterized protein n=1 Tax=Gossypium arboreum TaxID=29729 RepID=A0A0B0PS71_GOSAR|nr:hypothetical protein F383_02811 [Gossypium arboreum]